MVLKKVVAIFKPYIKIAKNNACLNNGRKNIVWLQEIDFFNYHAKF